MSGDQGQIERAKNEIHTIMERARGTIRMKAGHNQTMLLDGVERIKDAVAVWDLAGISSNLLRAKDDTRKVMRGRPVDMVMILNDFDSLEQEIGRLIPLMKKSKH